MLLPVSAGAAGQVERPNILVIVCEDISPYLGCYGDPVAVSPNLDNFARESIRHTGMFTTVGVSAPSRYSLITGRYSANDGANYMRINTFDKSAEVMPPAGVKCYTEYMRRAGYYCTNNAKTDYQFKAPVAAWDEQGKKAHWKHAPKDQPFFAIFNLESTHESKIWVNGKEPLSVSPEKVILPPYYPDCPEVRHDMAVMYSNITRMDGEFQALYDQLRESDRFENTIVIFYSDNGGPIPRGKRELYDSGSRVPFMIRFPDGTGAGTVNDNLNMFVDIPATILALAGVEIPDNIQGVPMYGGKGKITKRRYVFGATDRFDEQVEKRASIRDDRYLYVRNYMPGQSLYRPNAYRLHMPMMRAMEQWRDAGKLNDIQMQWFDPKAKSEYLFDCVEDPHNVHNLAEDKRYAKVLARMRKAFEKEWIEPYNQKWVTYTEADFTRDARPNGVKQVCEKPEVVVENGMVQVKNLRDDYSASYRIDGGRWQLYTAPFSPENGEKIEVIFERIGYVPATVSVTL